jgi:hypothetical protein
LDENDREGVERVPRFAYAGRLVCVWQQSGFKHGSFSKHRYEEVGKVRANFSLWAFNGMSFNAVDAEEQL